MNIEIFCLKNEGRKHVRTPFTQGGHTYATDGSIIIRVPKLIGYAMDDKKNFPIVTDLKWDHDSLEFEDPPSIKISGLPACTICDGLGRSEICDECKGEGIIIFKNTFSLYECECETCNGDGYTKGGDSPCIECMGTGKNLKENRIKFGERYFSAYYIYKIKKNLHVIKFSKNGDESEREPLRFKFDGGCGLLMPMKAI